MLSGISFFSEAISLFKTHTLLSLEWFGMVNWVILKYDLNKVSYLDVTQWRQGKFWCVASVMQKKVFQTALHINDLEEKKI